MLNNALTNASMSPDGPVPSLICINISICHSHTYNSWLARAAMPKQWWTPECCQPNPQVRHPASQPARPSLLGQQKAQSLIMWLVHSKTTNMKESCQSFKQPTKPPKIENQRSASVSINQLIFRSLIIIPSNHVTNQQVWVSKQDLYHTTHGTSSVHQHRSQNQR